MWIKQTRGLLCGIAMLAMGLMSTCLLSGHAAAATGINPQLSFEGKIVNTNGTNIADGTYNLEFKIYQDGTSTGSGSTLKWTEDYLVSASQGVVVTNGTFQVNLGSITAFGGTIDWNQSVLWLSMQVGNTSSCTVTTTFQSNCGGDSEMTPYIRLTSTPYALNSNLLNGLGSAAFGQLASSQTWTGTNTIQPTTNITGLVVKQTSNGSPSADIFNLQTANNTNIIQVTGPSANNAAVTISSVGGSSGLTLQSGSGTVSFGNSTTLNANGALTLSSGGTTQTLTLSTPASASAATGAITIQSGSATVGSNLNAGTITIDTGTRTGIGTAAINIGATNTAALTLGNATSTTTTSVEGGTAANAIQIGNGATAHGIQIGTGAAAQTIVLGSTNTTSTTTINAGSGNIVIGASTLQRVAVGTTTLDLKDASATTLSITNSGAGGASVSLKAGGSYTGAGAVTVSSGGATALGLDAGGGAAINIGSANATSIVLGGNTSATITNKVANSSTTAYQLQTAGATALLTVDTTNSKLTIGATGATPILLVLANKNTSGDPTEADGAMYYNSNTGNFRCGESGIWKNCIGGLLTSNTAASSAVNTCTAACPAFTTTTAFPANYCVPGRVLHIVANGVYSTAASATLAMGVYIGTNSSTKTSDTLIGAASGALSSGAAVTNQGWGVDFYINCFTTGTSGTVNGQGNFTMATSATANAAGGKMYSGTATTVNTTTAQTIYLFPAWGTSAAGDTATVQQFAVTGM